MKNDKTTTTATTETQSNNPFAFAEDLNVESKTRKLDFTPALQNMARTRVTDLIKLVSTERNDLADLANSMMDSGNPTLAIELISAIYDNDQIAADAAVLDGCPDDELGKMLESQRSNRSKSKKSGLRVKLANTVTYLSAMYAELMIRSKTGKPYSGSQSVALDYDALQADPEMLGKKINSLASKRSRLTKLAAYDESAKAELTETEEELAKLRAMRPTTSRTVVKSLNIDQLREALSKLDKSELPDEVVELMKKLG